MDIIIASFLEDSIVPKFNYWIYVILMMIGLYAMITKNNLIKKLIGMAIFQTGIILFYISMGAKADSTIPIIEHGHGHSAVQHAVEAAHYANPLTQILMLTAIVVGVATLGVGLALVQRVYSEYGSVEEDDILEKCR